MKKIFIVLLLFAGVTALAGAIVMTDLGQLLKVEKTTVVWYYRNRELIFVFSLIILAAAVIVNWKARIMRKWILIALCVLWAGAFFSSTYLVPYFMFPAQQRDARYVSIPEVEDGYLEEGNTVFVIDRNGEQKAYPPDYMWQSHIFGGEFGDDDVVMTYCVMANLPSPYLNQVDGEEVDFKVLAQTNNNLLIWDRNNGEIIQQITQQYEFSERKLEPVPVLEMTWRGYKKMYPNGKVLYNTWNTPMEKILSGIMSADDILYGEEWMFKTSNMDDDRFGTKEQVIGIRDDQANKQLAVSKEYVKSQGVCNVGVGSKRIAMCYFPEYDAYVAFDRVKDGHVLDVKEIDAYGNTPEHGQLEKAFVYSSVMWSVWVHYYPGTEILK